MIPFLDVGTANSELMHDVDQAVQSVLETGSDHQVIVPLNTCGATPRAVSAVGSTAL